MEHVVFFTGADGAAYNRRTPSLEEAVRVIEHLRNVEGVDDARVYSLTEVPLAFKTVYRVEIPGVTDEAPAAHAAPVEPPAPPAAVAPLPPMPPMPDLVAEAPAPAEAAAPAEPAVAAEPAPESAPAPVADEPALAAVPSEPFAPEPTPEPVSNGRRGTGFFAR